MQAPTLDRARLLRAKAAYTTRHVAFDDAVILIGGAAPKAGDMVLAAVTKVGHHQGLELRDGRKAALFAGDEVVVAYGNRYAPDQFEAEVCPDLRDCDLVAAGGVAACVVSRHDKARAPTRLRPIGLLGDAGGHVVNLSRYALPAVQARKTAYVFAVFGASMNAGKTTTAVSLIRGFLAAGYSVGSAKVTGTGAGGDIWQMSDAGAQPALDFTAAGAVSTYLVEEANLLRIFGSLTGHAMKAGVDVLVVEVADGLYQRETSMLARSPAFKALVDGVFFAARDALGAKAAVEWLGESGLEVIALSGTVTMSPLGAQEAREAVGLPVFGPTELADAGTIRRLVGRYMQRVSA